MRLTVSNKLFPNGEQMLKGYSDKYVQAMANKLSNLEDIEDELGIDLITLIKVWNAVLRQEYIWVRNKDGKIDISNDVSIGDEMNGLMYIQFYWDEGDHITYFLADYGKKWALTKEELL